MSDSATLPALPEGKYAEVGEGLRMHYHELGSGPAVLFVHGSGPGASGYSNFKGNFPAFAEAGFRAVVPDTLGYGYSSKPEDGDYSLGYLAERYVALLDSLGIQRVNLVGNSQGGAICTRIALDHPDRVERLVLMAPGGLEEREVYMGMSGIRTMMKVFLGPDGITREGMRKVFGLQLFDPSTLEEATLDERLEIAATQPKRVMTSLGVPHLSPRLAELTCPVLGWWGTDDNFCPPTGAVTLGKQCKDARVVTLSRCGHWVMVEHAALFNRWTAEFLEG